ncbi:prepilin peptidase CpaA [Palleronia marisminoris]|uniref:Type IV leader peptidase family protein n=1 Tax=Palleronia marisminoris TaxID=315423 RepID=A0A1Y5T2S6_9RHOB|nr:prepilin peptidase [Palleronia marisminoris]SFH14912.1 prepilin peptidase CpaA [Palleronia marisminoris]SLN54646.1 Type IV leader peptidase family protein [Palleronia marisminoris]
MPLPVDFALPDRAAAIFFILTLPACGWVALSDLRHMKIRNAAVLTLAAIFLVIGPLVLPLDLYLWQIVQGLVMLAVGFALNLARAMGAGDAKFLAAAAPFVLLPDAYAVLVLLSVMLLMAVALHRSARRIPQVTRLAPRWKSWGARKFPMGLGLGPTLSLYLAVAAFG